MRPAGFVSAVLGAVVAVAAGSRAVPPRPAEPARTAAATDPSAASRAALARGELRVCADPNNLPFSDRRATGFDDRIAALLAGALGARVTYTWHPERRGFLRETLDAGRCDVVLGVPSGDDRVLTTRPYYRSGYVFVQRRGARPIRSFDDPRLRSLRVGIHVIGDDYNSLPPGVALARRGIVRNVVGYSIYGNYAREAPPADLIRAVARGDVDVAVAWGPLAGYFATRSGRPLELTPVPPDSVNRAATFVYDIAAGVRRGDTALRSALDGALARRRDEGRAIRAEYGVPALPGAGAETAARAPHEEVAICDCR
jgi:mxaJ protein